MADGKKLSRAGDFSLARIVLSNLKMPPIPATRRSTSVSSSVAAKAAVFSFRSRRDRRIHQNAIKPMASSSSTTKRYGHQSVSSEESLRRHIPRPEIKVQDTGEHVPDFMIVPSAQEMH
jgi:hypothetical protein